MATHLLTGPKRIRIWWWIVKADILTSALARYLALESGSTQSLAPSYP